jgi:hypothetical protein
MIIRVADDRFEVKSSDGTIDLEFNRTDLKIYLLHNHVWTPESFEDIVGELEVGENTPAVRAIMTED